MDHFCAYCSFQNGKQILFNIFFPPKSSDLADPIPDRVGSHESQSLAASERCPLGVVKYGKKQKSIVGEEVIAVNLGRKSE